MTIDNLFLKAVQGKLDADVDKNGTKVDTDTGNVSDFLVPVQAAIRKLNISEEEQERFMIDIHKYADSIDVAELREIPKDKVLPHLLNCIWRAQVRSTKSESEFNEARSKEEEEESDGEYETIDEEEEGQEHVEGRKSDTLSGGTEGGSRKGSHEDSQKAKTKGVHKYKLLLDNVAPFYLEKEELPLPPNYRESTRPSSTTATVTTGANLGMTYVSENPLDPNSKSGQRRFSRSVWRYAINHMEPEYRLPTLILKKHQYIKREEPRNLGPGTYDPHFYECRRAVRLRQTRGAMYSCLPRWEKENQKMEGPSAMAYGNPYDTYEKLCRGRKYSSKVSIMQSGPCDVRAATFKTVGCALGPGEYDIKSPIEELINKHVGRRGPYDCFSQSDRFDQIHGYFTRSKISLEPGQYGIIGSMKQELFNRYNSLKGKWGKLNRDQKCTGERITVVAPMWPTAETESKPGPGTYETQNEATWRRTCWGENYWAFNTSTKARPELPADYDNAPTRYRPHLANRRNVPRGAGFKSNFRSKSTRLDAKTAAALGERLRAKDIPPWEKHVKDDEDCYVQTFIK